MESNTNATDVVKLEVDEANTDSTALTPLQKVEQYYNKLNRKARRDVLRKSGMFSQRKLIKGVV